KLIAEPLARRSPGCPAGWWQLTTAVLIHDRDRKMVQVPVRTDNGADIARREKTHKHNHRDYRHHPESRALQQFVDRFHALLIIWGFERRSGRRLRRLLGVRGLFGHATLPRRA